VAPDAVQRHQQEREEDVELLLDRQAPGVQHRQVVGCILEIAARIAPEKHVRNEEQRRDDGLPHLVVVAWAQYEPTRDQAGHDHGKKRRQDAARAPFVKAEDGKPPLG
jgi:hypothetical protein